MIPPLIIINNKENIEIISPFYVSVSAFFVSEKETSSVAFH